MAMACDCERAVPALPGFHMLNSKALTKWELDNGSLISSIGMWRSPCGVFAGIYAHLYESMQQGQPSEMPIRLRDPTCATVFVVTAAALPEWPYLQLTQMSSLTRHFKHVCGGPVEEGDVLIFTPHGDDDTALFDVCLRRGCTSAQPPRTASEDLCPAELEPEGRAEAAAAGSPANACECSSSSSSSQGTSSGWGTGEGTASMCGSPSDLAGTGLRSVELQQRSPQVPTPAPAALGAAGTRPPTRTGGRRGGGDSPDPGSPNAHGDVERQGQSDEVCYHKLVPSNVACKSIQFTAHMMRTVFKDLRTDPTTTAFTLSLDPRDPQHRQEQQMGGQQQEQQQGSGQQTSWKIRLNDHRKRRTYGYGFGPVQERLRYGAGSVLAFRRDTSGPLRYFVRLLPGDAAPALVAEAAATAARAADPAAAGAATASQQQPAQQHPASAAACSGPATPTQRHPGRPGAASNHPGSALPGARPRGAFAGKRVGSNDEAHVRDNGTTTAEPQAAAAAATGPGTAEAEGGTAARPAKQRRVDVAASAGGVAAAGGSSPDDLICFRKIMNYNMKHRRVKFTQDMLSTAFKPLLDDPTMMTFTLLLDSERDPHPLPGGSVSCHGGGGNGGGSGGGDGSSRQPSPDPQPSWQITVGRHDKKGNTVGYGYGPVQQHLGYKPGDVVRFRRDPHDPSRYYIRLVSNLAPAAAAAGLQ